MTGPEIWEAGEILSNGLPSDIAALYSRYPHDRMLKTQPIRYKRVYQSVPAFYKHLVPDGIAAARELSKFGREKLIKAFEQGWINRESTRLNIDALYQRLTGKVVARRHETWW